jgi:hypothetical protein
LTRAGRQITFGFAELPSITRVKIQCKSRVTFRCKSTANGCFGSSTDFDCNLKAAVQAAAIADESVAISYVGQADAVMRAASAT